MYIIEFVDVFDDEQVVVKLAQQTLRRFYMEDEFEGNFTDINVEYRMSECGTAVLKRFDYFTVKPGGGIIAERHYLQFCTIEDFNTNDDGQLIASWSDNYGAYA